jgi:hypothetical protein
MRFIEFLVEGEQLVGAVVSTRGGRFYDISFVDYRTLQPLSGHYRNLGDQFVKSVENWEDVVSFFQEYFRGKPLGEEYSSEDAEFKLYGPIPEQQFNSLVDTFRQYAQ